MSWKQASRTAADGAHTSTEQWVRGAREASLIAFGAVALFLLLSLWTYESSDPGWSHSGHVDQVVNRGGLVGAWIADVFLYLMGLLAYLVPVAVGHVGWLLYRRDELLGGVDVYELTTRFCGFALALAGGSGLATLHISRAVQLPLDAGGVVGNLVGTGLVSVFSSLGATLFLLALFLTGMTLFTCLSWLVLIDGIGKYTLLGLGYIRAAGLAAREHYQSWQVRHQRATSVKVERQRVKSRKKPRIEPTITELKPSARIEQERQVPLFEPPAAHALPGLNLLDEPSGTRVKVSDAALEALSRQVELKLKDFNIEAEVVAVNPGPVVTRFEIQPAAGVKVSRITALAKDLARSLSTTSVRIVEVIPGKSVIGLEIPNEHREIVCLSEILKSSCYDESQSPLTLALGKDIAGNPVVVDLARMPHMLVAGTTGSGKSVALNAMVLSLLYKAVAHDVRLIMIDPKMLELSVYDGIPQLLAPVVTDTKDAANALRWCVAEMERRYKLMSTLGVRNLAGYNRKVRDASDGGNPIPDPTFKPAEGEEPRVLESLPMIVVIVDELADMMMTVGKKVEELIARLAQKARASGIHLILATQRPSVDVITGLIKANIPTRVAFQVSSKIDSRTILDQMGAEQLLGHGDMLFLKPGMHAPTRIHGAFVSDQEVHRVVEDLMKRGEPDYVDEIVNGTATTEDMDSTDKSSFLPDVSGETDALYDQAVFLVTESRRASISGVQRRLKIGYNRAARMIEQMETSGIVGPLQSNGSRQVLAASPPPS
jgi:S-DNA-T family DNA segregation ATPase FtsK/SpoIIIE